MKLAFQPSSRPVPMSAASATSDEFAPLLDPAGLAGALDGSASPTQESDPDIALMLEVAAGTERAFTTLLRRHQTALLNFFARMGASHACEDLVQETFLRLYRYRKRYRPSARFSTFLYHLARNAWADHGRKIVRIDRLADDLQREVELAEQGNHRRDTGQPDVQAALDRLSPKLREVIVLNIYQGLRYQEVADILGIPLGTVKSRINHAIGELKDLLDER
jgi:RNA polymerase sigma factor (sigma-70 family)